MDQEPGFGLCCYIAVACNTLLHLYAGVVDRKWRVCRSFSVASYRDEAKSLAESTYMSFQILHAHQSTLLRFVRDSLRLLFEHTRNTGDSTRPHAVGTSENLTRQTDATPHAPTQTAHGRLQSNPGEDDFSRLFS